MNESGIPEKAAQLAVKALESAAEAEAAALAAREAAKKAKASASATYQLAKQILDDPVEGLDSLRSKVNPSPT